MKMPDAKRREINEILKLNNIELTWLAKETGLDYDLLWRQLNTSKFYREDVNSAIVEALKKNGFITSKSRQIEAFKDDLLSGNAIINGALSLITKSFQRKVENDGDLDATETKDLIGDIRTYRDRTIDVFDEMILTLQMKKKG